MRYIARPNGIGGGGGGTSFSQRIAQQTIDSPKRRGCNAHLPEFIATNSPAETDFISVSRFNLPPYLPGRTCQKSNSLFRRASLRWRGHLLKVLVPAGELVGGYRFVPRVLVKVGGVGLAHHGGQDGRGQGPPVQTLPVKPLHTESNMYIYLFG